ncbi:MAG: hypothetical protein ACRD0L_16420 [Acidimicrobiales bacterium]
MLTAKPIAAPACAGGIVGFVTSLTAKAASFFSRSFIGCEKGQSGPQDVVAAFSSAWAT